MNPPPCPQSPAQPTPEDDPPPHSPEGGVECLPPTPHPHPTIAHAREGLSSSGYGLLLRHLDLLHLCSHLVDLVLLNGGHMSHAHGCLLLLLVVEGVDRVALGSVRGELRLIVGTVKGHDRVLCVGCAWSSRGLRGPLCANKRLSPSSGGR